MKIAVVVVLLALVGFMGWTTYETRQRVAETEAEIASLAEQRDSALVRAAAALDSVATLEVHTDSLTAALQAQQAAATIRMDSIQTEADSLGEALKAALDSLDAPERLRRDVDRLLALNTSLRAEYEAHVLLSDSVVAALRVESSQKTIVIWELQDAIELGQERERALEVAWQEALNPGWLETLFRDTKAKAGIAALAFVGGYIMGG